MKESLKLDHSSCGPFCFKVLLQTSVFMRFESLDGGGFVVLHATAVTGHVGTEDSSQYTLEFVLCHDPPPGAEGLAKSRMRETKLKRNRVGKGRSKPLDEVRVRFRFGEMKKMPLSPRNIPCPGGKNQMKLDREGGGYITRLHHFVIVG
jgi:hypothetical protein